MKLWKTMSIGLMATVMALSIGCGNKEEKEAKDLANEGKASITEINNENMALAQDYKVVVISRYGSLPTSVDCAGLDQAARVNLRKRLRNMSRKIGRVIEIIDHKNIYYGGDRAQLVEGRDRAAAYLASLEACN